MQAFYFTVYSLFDVSGGTAAGKEDRSNWHLMFRVRTSPLYSRAARALVKAIELCERDRKRRQSFPLYKIQRKIGRPVQQRASRKHMLQPR